MKTILAIAAHNDDQVIGAGGTLAKFASQGYRVRTIIFSFGELSHPHLKREVVIETRVRESIAADKLIGGSGVAYFDIKEGHFDEQIRENDVEGKLAAILKKEKPVMIFTHGVDDLHPDHRAVYRCVMRMVDAGVFSCPVYSFDIWSLIKLRKRNLPRMVVDIGDTFNVKLKAFLEHRSQKLAIVSLLGKVIIKDWVSGLLYGHKYAEVFYRLK